MGVQLSDRSMFSSGQELDFSVSRLVYLSSGGVSFKLQAHPTPHRDQRAPLSSPKGRHTPIGLEWREPGGRGEGTEKGQGQGLGVVVVVVGGYPQEHG